MKDKIKKILIVAVIALVVYFILKKRNVNIVPAVDSTSQKDNMDYNDDLYRDSDPDRLYQKKKDFLVRAKKIINNTSMTVKQKSECAELCGKIFAWCADEDDLHWTVDGMKKTALNDGISMDQAYVLSALWGMYDWTKLALISTKEEFDKYASEVKMQ